MSVPLGQGVLPIPVTPEFSEALAGASRAFREGNTPNGKVQSSRNPDLGLPLVGGALDLPVL